MAAARPEAAFYRWKALTKEQRRVASQLNSWLLDYSKNDIPPRATGKSIFDWQRIDDTRASNVILIDGPRGAGKTSLLLTLVEVWRRSLAEEKLDEVFEAKPNETDLSGQDAQGALKALRGRIIPIRVLDFAPLPRSTSIINWVAAQLREFIDLLDERTSPAFSDLSTRPVVPWEPDWEKELPSRKAWADLTASAAWGWDDNIEERKGGLDPDAYAEELQQSERARVGIVERWHRLIPAIVKDAWQRYRGRIDVHARIIVPIDDVDMNPRRVAELLDFVRTFWDAQLVFVLTGDTNLILAALKQRQAEALDTSGSGFSVHELAAQTYDKVVPLAQRFRIGPLQPEERVELMREQIFPSRNLTPRPQEESAFEDLLRRNRWAAEGLPATLREVHDARQNLAGRMKVSEIVAYIWDDALEREVPKIKDRYKIAQHVDLGREGMPSVETDIEARALRLGEFHISSNEPRTARCRLVLETVSGFVPYDMPENAPRLRGALLMAADLAANDPDSAWSAISIAGNGFKFPAVRARIVVPIKSSSSAVKKQAESLLRRGLRWPVPNWPAPADLARFAEEWRQASSKTEILARRDDKDLARLFLERIRSIQSERDQSPSSLRPAKSEETTTLKSMIALIRQDGLGTATTQRQEAFIEWARGRALLLATPESGVQVSTVNELLSGFPEEPKPLAPPQPDRVADPVFDPVYQARFDRARVTLQTTLQKSISAEEINAILAAIDGSFPNHPWVKKFGAWTPERATDE